MPATEATTADSPEAPVPPTRRPRPTRQRGLLAAAGALALVVGLFGSYQVRRMVGGDGFTVCIVTERSLADPTNLYDGGDHPTDPEPGEEYWGPSGCYPGETACIKRVELLGSHLAC